MPLVDNTQIRAYVVTCYTVCTCEENTHPTLLYHSRVQKGNVRNVDKITVEIYHMLSQALCITRIT